ncbi:acyl-CoA dehydrogenase family protein [Pendulispora albinea]|uniref:Acyl-CoA dehydrogenase family protein n=1 Tax=Pendulispora albinea TaxID=2741071 RepID=A0ABZ2LV78_9BACT
MSNFFKDNDDLAFYYDKGIDWAPLVEVTEYGYRTEGGFKAEGEAMAFYREVAEMVGDLAANDIATRAAAIDREEVRLQHGEVVAGPAMAAIFERIRAMDLHRLCLPRELGGLNAPLLTYFVNIELIARADVSVMAHHSFHGGMALAMLAYSLSEGSTSFDPERARILRTRFADEIDEVARGDAWGSMDITEPNAGSDMAALRAVAEQDASGRWFVSGQKIFITSGHGKYHFVIARTESAPSAGAPGASDDPLAGLGGLSMFLVKAYEDRPDGTRHRYVTIDRVEEKLGQHGSVTASLLFERAPAELIGQRGEGFKCMLLLMNNARLGVGFESIGLCEAAYRMAKAYAEERRSMGKPVARHEMIADYLDEMRTDIQGLRALAMYGAFHEEMSQKLRFLDKVGEGIARPEETERIQRHLPMHVASSRRVTPLLKYLAAEKAVEMARRAMQIHGGAGYTRDYGAEKLLRDAMVMPIYEGTSQIQALMAMKDQLLALVRRPHAFLARLARARWQRTSARDPLARRVAGIELLALRSLQHLAARTAVDKLRSLPDQLRGNSGGSSSLRRALGGWNPKRDFARAMLHAERVTRILADEAICDVLLEQARKFPERRELLERYLERAELRCHALHREITTTGDRILQNLAASDAPRPERKSDSDATPSNPSTTRRARDAALAAAE